MSTLKQIEANRRNAQKSTGPRTIQGKAVSRMNALKTGIDAEMAVMPGEDPDALQALTAEYYDLYQPASPPERFWLDVMVRSEWLRRRMCKIEGDMWSDEHDDDDEFPAAKAFNYNAREFSRLQRRIDSAERNYYRAQCELERLQSSRQATVDHTPRTGAPQPVAPNAQSPNPNTQPQIGFVPHLTMHPPLTTPGHSLQHCEWQPYRFDSSAGVR